MYICSLMEQNCYHVSKRTTPLDLTPSAGTDQPAQGAEAWIRNLHVQSRILECSGQRYVRTNGSRD
jgi:hypothetical protein